MRHLPLQKRVHPCGASFSRMGLYPIHCFSHAVVRHAAPLLRRVCDVSFTKACASLRSFFFRARDCIPCTKKRDCRIAVSLYSHKSILRYPGHFTRFRIWSCMRRNPTKVLPIHYLPKPQPRLSCNNKPFPFLIR